MVGSTSSAMGSSSGPFHLLELENGSSGLEWLRACSKAEVEEEKIRMQQNFENNNWYLFLRVSSGAETSRLAMNQYTNRT